MERKVALFTVPLTPDSNGEAATREMRLLRILHSVVTHLSHTQQNTRKTSLDRTPHIYIYTGNPLPTA